MAEQQKLALHPVPYARQDKCVRKFVKAEIGGEVIMIQQCAECQIWTDEAVICRDCQKNGEWCR